MEGGPRAVGPAEHRARDFLLGHVEGQQAGALQARIREVRPGARRAGQVSADQRHALQQRAAELRSAQVRATQVRPMGIAARQVRRPEVLAGECGTGERCRASVKEYLPGVLSPHDRHGSPSLNAFVSHVVGCAPETRCPSRPLRCALLGRRRQGAASSRGPDATQPSSRVEVVRVSEVTPLSCHPSSLVLTAEVTVWRAPAFPSLAAQGSSGPASRPR
jgi:hypothetical protein